MILELVFIFILFICVICDAQKNKKCKNVLKAIELK